MFGLLGGLMGRGMAGAFASRPMAHRPLAGLLAGRAVKNALNPRQAQPSAFASGKAPPTAEKPEPETDNAPVEQGEPQAEQPVAQQRQPQQPLQPVQKNAEELQQVEQERQQTIQTPEEKVDQRPVTAGLLEEAPAATPERQPTDPDMVAPPEQVVNHTESLTPVAPIAGEQFGETPPLFLSGLVDRIGQQPPRRFFAAEDPVPMKQADVKSQARHTANRPDMSFGLASSATSYTPSYSYRR